MGQKCFMRSNKDTLWKNRQPENSHMFSGNGDHAWAGWNSWRILLLQRCRVIC